MSVESSITVFVSFELTAAIVYCCIRTLNFNPSFLLVNLLKQAATSVHICANGYP